MAGHWRHYEAGLFALELPPGWVPEDHPTGSLMVRDRRTGLAMHLHAKSVAAAGRAERGGARGASRRIVTPQEVNGELREFMKRHRRVRVAEAPHLLSGAGALTSAALGRQRVRDGVAWYKRMLGLGPVRAWRFWAVMNSHLLVFASCSGPERVVEQNRVTLDRMLASLRLPQRDLLVGRHFTEAVATIARGCFPQTSVAMIDDVHLRFGSCQVDLVGLHRKYLASPEDLPRQVRSFFSEVQRLHNGGGGAAAWEQICGQILPLLVEESKLANFGMHCVHEEWVNGLHITYVVEDAITGGGGGGAYRAVTTDEMLHWGVGIDELHEQAVENLTARSGELRMTVSRAEDCTVLALSDPERYNASRVLLPGFSRTLREHLGTTFYVGIPAREFLVAFQAKGTEALARVRAQIRSDYEGAGNPVSDKLFVATPDGIAGYPGED